MPFQSIQYWNMWAQDSSISFFLDGKFVLEACFTDLMVLCYNTARYGTAPGQSSLYAALRWAMDRNSGG